MSLLKTSVKCSLCFIPFPIELRHTVQVFWGTSQMLLLLSMEGPVPKLPSKVIILNTIIIPTKMVMRSRTHRESSQRPIPGKCLRKEVVLWMLPWQLFSATVDMLHIIISPTNTQNGQECTVFSRWAWEEGFFSRTLTPSPVS